MDACLRRADGFTLQKPQRLDTGAISPISCFAITIHTKSYLWETESTRHQDDFLVTLVRSFRQYMSGAPLRLTGFQVGEIPGAPSAYEVPHSTGGLATPTYGNSGQNNANLTSPPLNMGRGTRPSTANSVVSNASSYYGASSHSQIMQQPPPPIHPSSFPQTGQSNLDPNDGFLSTLGMRPSPSPSSSLRSLGHQPPQSFNAMAMEQQQQQQQQQSTSRPVTPNAVAQAQAIKKKASSGSLHSTGAGNGSSSSQRPPLPVPPANVSPRLQQQQNAPMRSPPPLAQQQRQQVTPGGQSSPQAARRISTPAATPPPRTAITPSSSSNLDEMAAAANAAALLGQQSQGKMDDSDIMLTNVEEMLEGFEWGQTAPGGQGGADQIEKRLLGELNALEAAGIHAIIESDDRVGDVVKYLDSALAELDKMDQMMSLYKTHLHVRMI